MDKEARIFIAGHTGMVGSAILRRLQEEGYSNLLLSEHDKLDLTNQKATMDFFTRNRPAYVFLAAAKVGGISANAAAPANFIYENLMIEANVIHAAFENKIKKLAYLGSSCIYPKYATQPIAESELLTGELEPTNKPYAIAKIAGVELCQAYNRQHGCNYISLMPTNLYGPGDNYDLETSHVLPALLRKFHEAKEQEVPLVSIWGSGKPMREFLHVNDLADACLFLMKNYNEAEIINVGTGRDISIQDLAMMIKEVVGYGGDLSFDASRPDGTPRKLLDVSKLHGLGWMHKISLREGIEMVYEEVSQKEFA